MKFYKLTTKYLLMLCTVYIIISALLYYTFSLSLSEKNYNYSVSTHIDVLVNNINEYLNENRHIISNLSTNETVMKNTSSKHSSQELIDIVEELRIVLKPITSYFNHIMLYYPGEDKLLMSNGSCDIDVFASSVGIEPQLFRDCLKQCVENDNQKSTFIPSSIRADRSAIDYLTLIYSYQVSDGDEFVMVSVCDRKKLLSTDLMKNIKGISALVLPDNTAFSDGKIQGEKLEKIIANPGMKYKKVSSTMISSYLWGDISLYFIANKWNYLVYTNSFLPIWLIVTALFVLIGFVLVRYLSKRIYAPVNDILYTLSPDKVDDEIRFIQSSIKALQTENESMTESINVYRQTLADKFLLELMTSAVPEDKMKSNISSLPPGAISFPLIAFSIEMKNYDELVKLLDYSECFEIQQTVKAIFERTLAKHKYFKMMIVNHYSYVALISLSDYNDFRRNIQPIMFSIEEQLSVVLSTIVGGIIRDWSDFRAAYENFVLLKQQNILVNESSLIIFPSDIDRKKNDNINYPVDVEQQLIARVIAADSNAVFASITEIVDGNMKNKILTKEQHSSFIVMLYATISKILATINKSERDLYKDDFVIYLELKQCTTAGMLKAKYYEIINNIMEYIISIKNQNEDSSSKTMKQYIEQHYKEDISLLSMAEYMNMSQYYVSKLFKSSIGENFKDYLAKYRLQIAVEQMKKNPTKKISQIADEVGINSTTLTRLFSKYYNVTPSEFVKNMYNSDEVV